MDNTQPIKKAPTLEAVLLDLEDMKPLPLGVLMLKSIKNKERQAAPLSNKGE